MKSNNKISLIMIIAGVIISVVRASLEGNSEYSESVVLVFMAAVNALALCVVLACLFYGLKNKCEKQINSSGIATTRKKKCRHYIMIANSIFLILICVVAFMYVWKWKTTVGNDIMSIIALAISIANDRVIEDYNRAVYSFLLKIAK